MTEHEFLVVVQAVLLSRLHLDCSWLTIRKEKETPKGLLTRSATSGKRARWTLRLLEY